MRKESFKSICVEKRGLINKTTYFFGKMETPGCPSSNKFHDAEYFHLSVFLEFHISLKERKHHVNLKKQKVNNKHFHLFTNSIRIIRFHEKPANNMSGVIRIFLQRNWIILFFVIRIAFPRFRLIFKKTKIIKNEK
jgi:hypothetical protein